MPIVIDRLGFIEPQLPTLTDEPPQGEGWIHEIKHDGYRTLLILESRKARAYTRNGFDWSDRYRMLLDTSAKLKCRSAIIDGEIVVQDARGVSDFEALKSAIRNHPERLILYAFDLLHRDGKDIREEPLLDRRAKLKELVGKDPSSPIQFSDEFDRGGAALFRACVTHGLEGMVSKLASSRYRSGRTKTWLKTKCFTESAFVIIGTDRDRKTGALRALLAKSDRRGLTYAGAAFIALSGDEREDLLAHLERLIIARPSVPGLRLAGAQWADPRMTVRVRHLAGSKYLRHGTVRAVTD